ncbi:glycosyltransferase family protein [Nitrosopumilus zosterae]|nr:glycosyltransferase family protein [Nitrosopumilus zosterae]BDQ31801.1 glycosyltransferase family protein [Nitrosopumilus zosterae]
MRKIDNNFTVIDYVIRQLKSSKKIDKILIATTNLKEDDVICDHLFSQNVEYFRGSSDDVLDRYFQCAKKKSADIIVRITADNPLIDPNIVDSVISDYENNDCDYASNTLLRTFPYGTEVEVFSFKTLQMAWKKAKKPSEREHVTPFIYEPQNNFNLKNTKHLHNLSHLRYTVDRIEDLILVKKIIKNVHDRPILLKDILQLYKTNPNIFKINEKVKHDGYITSLKKDEQHLKRQK